MSVLAETSFALPIAVNEMTELYGITLNPRKQALIDRQDSDGLIHALRIPWTCAEPAGERSFPPQLRHSNARTELGKLTVSLEALRAEPRVSFNSRVSSCSETEPLFLRSIAAVLADPEADEHTPVTIFVSSDGEPIGFCKNEGFQSTLMLSGINDETTALVGSIVTLENCSGQDLGCTYVAAKSTKLSSVTVAPIDSLRWVKVARLSTFAVSPEFRKQTGSLPAYDFDAVAKATLANITADVRRIAELAEIT